MKYLLILVFLISSSSFSKNLIDYRTLRNSELIRQTHQYSCGSATLATLMKFYFGYSNFTELTALEKLGIDEDREISFLELKKVVEQYGIDAVGLELTKDDIFQIQKPVIAYIKTPLESDHFVVIKGIYKNMVFIGDPAIGNYFLTEKQFLKVWLSNSSNSGLILFVQGDQTKGTTKFFNIQDEKLGQKIFFNR